MLGSYSRVSRLQVNSSRTGGRGSRSSCSATRYYTISTRNKAKSNHSSLNKTLTLHASDSTPTSQAWVSCEQPREKTTQWMATLVEQHHLSRHDHRRLTITTA